MREFRRHSHVQNSAVYPPTFNKRKSVKRKLQSAFSIVNCYLWLHGIGFSRRISYKKNHILGTVVSIGFVIIFEGLLFYIMYHPLQRTLISDLKPDKDILSTNVSVLLNAILRFVFYAKRRVLKDADLKLISLYSKVCDQKRSIIYLKVKLTVMLLFNDVVFFISLYYYYNNTDFCRYFVEAYGKLPFLSNFQSYFFFMIVWWWGFIYTAAVSYFWLVCFVLKEMFTEINTKVKEMESKTFINIYGEINDLLIHMNNILQPFLVACITSLLAGIFREAYYALFLATNDAWIYSFYSVYLFIYFTLICLASSTVINASEEVRFAIQKHLRNFTGLKSLPFVTCITERFEGFRIFSSIAIDCSLVLTASGALLTYGMLIATMNISKQTSN